MVSCAFHFGIFRDRLDCNVMIVYLRDLDEINLDLNF
jgi:hypothetical protein